MSFTKLEAPPLDEKVVEGKNDRDGIEIEKVMVTAKISLPAAGQRLDFLASVC